MKRGMSLTQETLNAGKSGRNELPEEERKRLLCKVHIAKKQLQLSDEEYRGILQSVAGVSSAKYLDMSGFKAVLKRFKEMGFRVKFVPSPSSNQKSTKEQKDMIRALWIELSKAGKLRNGSDTALNHFVRNRFKVERVEWLTPKQAGAVIEALKQWLAREPSKA